MKGGGLFRRWVGGVFQGFFGAHVNLAPNSFCQGLDNNPHHFFGDDIGKNLTFLVKANSHVTPLLGGHGIAKAGAGEDVLRIFYIVF